MSRARGSLVFTPYKAGPRQRSVLAERESPAFPLATRTRPLPRRPPPSSPPKRARKSAPEDLENAPTHAPDPVPEDPIDDEPPIAPLAEIVPSNCGGGPHGEAELMLEIDVPSLLAVTHSASLASLPPDYFADLRAQGFEWIFLTNYPEDADIEDVRALVHRGGLRLLNGEFDDVSNDDGRVLPDADPALARYDYCFDPGFVEALRARDAVRFAEALVRPGPVRIEHMLHFSTTDRLAFSPRSAFAASAALLLLPGLRAMRHRHWPLIGALLPVLTRPVLRRGTFSVPEVRRYHAHMAVWKYADDLEHVIVCLNFAAAHAVASIICPDAPDPIEYDKIQVFEYLTETTYRRDAAEMRTAGLHVILREYEIQVFSY
jgi:hypothetical protein